MALAFLFPVTLGGQALLPADALYLTPPWSAAAAEMGVTTVHNPLIADQILQNYSWKTFIRESFRNGELPLWNPYVFTGMPFLAAGQYAALYPPGLLFVILPVVHAYGWFTALHLFLAGAFMYALLRALGHSRAASTLEGVAFMFCGFLVVSFLWPMVVSSAIWLPFLLLCVERIASGGEQRNGDGLPRRSASGLSLLAMTEGGQASGEAVNLQSSVLSPQSSVLAWSLTGAVGLALHLLAGHLEISFYVLFTVLMYSLVRLGFLWRDQGWPAAGRAWLGMAAMAMLGVGLAGVQLVPFYELIRENYRAGQVTAQEVLGWALPLRQAAAFVMPDVFGNPSHHSYFDLFTWTVEPISGARDTAGEARNYPFWGIKNYVEGTAYIGILPLLLAAIALARRWDRTTGFFALYGGFCLLLAFGSPLYTLLFYGVPGFDQVHSPFRWTFPWAFSTIVLAARGLDVLLGNQPLRRGAPACAPAGIAGGSAVSGRHVGLPLREQGAGNAPQPHPVLSPRSSVLGWAALGGGLVILIGAALSRFLPERSLAYAAGLREGSQALAAAFATPEMLYSYEVRALVILGLLLAAAGALVWAVRRLAVPHYGYNVGHPEAAAEGSGVGWPSSLAPAAVSFLAIGLVALDLFQFGAGFNTATGPVLASYVPPSLRLLQADPELFRVTTFGDGQILRPNSGMLAGLQDIRGYDTVIPRQYVDFWRLLEEPSGLLYSQINRLADPRSLSSPLLDLMNVKYVLTTDDLTLPGYTPVYRGEVNIYRNDDVLPRAFAVFRTVDAAGPDEALIALAAPAFDPRREVVLERPSVPGSALSTQHSALVPNSVLSPQSSVLPLLPAQVVSYRPNQVVVSVRMPQEGYLVLTDQFFSGWRATSASGDLPILRANGIFRAVHLEPGEHTVTFRYAPQSFRLGLLISVMAAAALALGAGVLGWRRLLPEAGELSAAGRVVKNSVTPMAAQVVSRLVDFAFAVFMLRLLGPAEYGNYAFAVVLIGYFAILSDFGLGTLLTRDVARNLGDAGRYLTNVLAVRLALCIAAAPVLGGVLWVYSRYFGLAESAVLAALLFLVSLFPSAVSATISSLFSAYERMEYAALVSVLTTLIRVAAGVAALAVFEGGVVGLAVASVVASTATAVIFFGLFLRFSLGASMQADDSVGANLVFAPPSPLGEYKIRPYEMAVGEAPLSSWQRPDLGFSWSLMGSSFPLMINQFLNTIFFRVDVLFLQALHGSAAVGYYSTAYKFVDGLIIIPSLFTLALFPVLSRHAAASPEALSRTHTRAVKLLLLVALPVSVGMTLISDQLILTFFGPDFAPSILALQVLIWFLPFSYVNGVTQYVLIAAGRQRFITVAFLIGTAFNIVSNLVLIPRYGLLGAAATTVLSELVLLGPFLWEIRRHAGPLPLGRLLLRPTVAALAMGLLLLPLRSWSMFLLAPMGLLIYAIALLLLGTFDEEDRKLAAAVRWSRTK